VRVLDDVAASLTARGHHLVRIEVREHLRARPQRHPRLDVLLQLLVVRHPRDVGGEARVLPELGVPHRLEQPHRDRLVGRRDRQPLPVGGLVDAAGDAEPEPLPTRSWMKPVAV
jgi:hypothetical protein